MVFESTWIERVANSTPIVDLESRLNSLRVNRLSRLDLPTPESPISTTIHPSVFLPVGLIHVERAMGGGRGREDAACTQGNVTFEEELKQCQPQEGKKCCGLKYTHIVLVVSHSG